MVLMAAQAMETDWAIINAKVTTATRSAGSRAPRCTTTALKQGDERYPTSNSLSRNKHNFEPTLRLLKHHFAVSFSQDVSRYPVANSSSGRWASTSRT
jgi:hypothetical protein